MRIGRVCSLPGRQHWFVFYRCHSMGCRVDWSGLAVRWSVFCPVWALIGGLHRGCRGTLSAAWFGTQRGRRSMTGRWSPRIPGLLQVIFAWLRPLSYPHTDVIWLFCAKDSQDTLLNLRYLGYSSWWVWNILRSAGLSTLSDVHGGARMCILGHTWPIHWISLKVLINLHFSSSNIGWVIQICPTDK